MKVLFTNDVPGQGRKGDIKEVAAGFAYNFLIKKGLAAAADEQLLQTLQAKEQHKKDRATKNLQLALKQKINLEKRLFTIAVKVGNSGKLFGSVQEKDIVAVLNKDLGLKFEKTRIHLNQPIRALGQFTAQIRLDPAVTAVIKLQIIAPT